LENYLSTRYTFSVGKMVCEYCNFIAKNQQALSAHHRGCTVRKSMVEEKKDTTSLENIVLTTPSEKTKEMKPKKTKITIKTP